MLQLYIEITSYVIQEFTVQLMITVFCNYLTLWSSIFLYCPSPEQQGEQSSPCSSIAELSPGAVGAGRAEHQTTINSMMLERMSTDVRALTQQYYRTKRRQQQQANLLYIQTGS